MINTAVRRVLQWQQMTMDALASGDAEEHEHCKTCVRMKCNVKPNWPDSCEVIDCENRCGMRLHKCKQIEHLQVCQNQRVPCINLEAGCPHVMPRRDRGRHLEVCPASVIHCTVEWNRWPVYSAERQARVPFVQDNLHAKYGQLDVALALRDQRVLNEAMKAPRSTRRALRNPLTQRFPAVPLTSKFSSSQVEANPFSGDTSQTISDDDSDAPWEVRKNPPGLQRSVCNELFKATRQITESLSAAISVATEPPAPHMLAKIPEAYEYMDDAALYHKKLEALAKRDDAGGDVVIDNDETVTNSFCESMKVLEDGIAKTAAKLEESSLATKASTATTNNMELDMMGDNRFTLQIDLKSERTKITDTNGCSGSYTPPLQRVVVPEPPPPPTIMLKQILALDLNIESITRYQAKPKSMYTFLCAQQFRRDEYSWHFKNVHSDIHGGLSGWLEHRCPLAHYGCTYSTRRLHPSPRGSKLVHNNIIEAFGVQPHVPSKDDLRNEGLKREHSNLEPNSATKDNTKVLATGKSHNHILQHHSGIERDAKESTPEILTSKDYDSAVFINGNAELIKKEDPGVYINGDAEFIEKDACGDGVAVFSCDNQRDSAMEKEEDDDVVAMDACDDDQSTSVIGGKTDNNHIPNDIDAIDFDILTSLPFEILSHIVKFLDPFSLGNVALTSKVLREVACSLLETRGIVLLHWERQKFGNKITWQTIYKRWMFSTAFTPVKQWGFEENPHMGNHLRTCPFYRAEAREGPVLLPSMEGEFHTLPPIQDALKRMYPDFVTYQEMMENTLDK